ncbi:hypothetical protein B5M42_017535 [Paenibacillus athensensis]|uniref:Uncharacterized protein n=1 Tax=Paenibacillus athensensis TaxID=1967502 RepID=A0A4Y8PYS5_9BACL|nr:hypothetical protein [Paenibacillus athensensis]MCD1260608.1 hypothetical protein [Paenibacillus athensensis]
MTTNETTEQPSQEEQQQKEAEMIIALFQHAKHLLQQQYPEFVAGGQIGQHPAHGPLFAFTLEKDGNTYACGFLLNEVVRAFQGDENPGVWLSSYFVDMIRAGQHNPLPVPPQTEDEAKAVYDNNIVPHCAQSAREEFDGETVYVDLEFHEEAGPILEAGFPAIKEGNNTCAMPLAFLMTLYLLNRDPAEPLIAALYKLKSEHAAS